MKLRIFYLNGGFLRKKTFLHNENFLYPLKYLYPNHCFADFSSALKILISVNLRQTLFVLLSSIKVSIGKLKTTPSSGSLHFLPID